MPIELWPPLNVIRSHLVPGQASLAAQQAEAGEEAIAAAAPQGTRDIDLQLPLAELARRRQVLAARNFNARWEPGRIVSVLHEGRLLGGWIADTLGIAIAPDNMAAILQVFKILGAEASYG